MTLLIKKFYKFIDPIYYQFQQTHNTTNGANLAPVITALIVNKFIKTIIIIKTLIKKISIKIKIYNIK